jgi:hypothetical protein
VIKTESIEAITALTKVGLMKWRRYPYDHYQGVYCGIAYHLFKFGGRCCLEMMDMENVSNNGLIHETRDNTPLSKLFFVVNMLTAFNGN